MLYVIGSGNSKASNNILIVFSLKYCEVLHFLNWFYKLETDVGSKCIFIFKQLVALGCLILVSFNDRGKSGDSILICFFYKFSGTLLWCKGMLV